MAERHTDGSRVCLEELNLTWNSETTSFLCCPLSPCNHMARPQSADEGTASRYGRWPRIYRKGSTGQPTRGGPPGWGLGALLTSPHFKHIRCYEISQEASDLARSFTSLKQGLKITATGCLNNVLTNTWGVRFKNWTQTVSRKCLGLY